MVDSECHIDHVDRNPIIRPAPDIILQTDSSLKGWGAKSIGGGSTGGRWNYMESLEHILSTESCIYWYYGSLQNSDK